MKLSLSKYHTACSEDEGINLYINDKKQTIEIELFKLWCDKKISKKITKKDFKLANLDLIEFFILKMSEELSEEVNNYLKDGEWKIKVNRQKEVDNENL